MYEDEAFAGEAKVYEISQAELHSSLSKHRQTII